MKHIFCLAVTLLLLPGSASRRYTKSDLPAFSPGTEVVVIYDYLTITDDLGKRFDFKEGKNREGLEDAGKFINRMLKQRGYVASDKTLKSGGMGLQGQVRANQAGAEGYFAPGGGIQSGWILPV